MLDHKPVQAASAEKVLADLPYFVSTGVPASSGSREEVFRRDGVDRQLQVLDRCGIYHRAFAPQSTRTARSNGSSLRHSEVVRVEGIKRC